MKKVFLTGLFLVSVLGGFTLANKLPDPETRGVWITEAYLGGGPDSIGSMIKRISADNINVIYVEVYHLGSTIYPSAVIRNAGGVLQNSTFTGRSDPLKTIIQIAHRYGIEVIAWFSSPFMVAQSSDSTRVPPIFIRHPDWAATQRDTTKRFFPPRGDYGYTFEVDPSVPSAADFIVDLETECARKYPGIDGIESDIENDTTGSYSDIARIRFMKDTGKPDPLTLPDTDSAWLSWRRLQVTTIVKSIYEGIKRVNPRCVVSAAVDPPFYGQKWKLESWDVWARKHYVDFLEPMLYVRKDIFDDQLKWCLGNVPSGFKLNAGVAINSAGSAANTVYEIRQARRMGAAGTVVWYYGYLLSYPDAMMDLKSQVFTGKTLPSYDDLVIDVANAKHFHTSGIWTAEKGGYGGTYRSAPAAQGDTAIFSTRILRSGDYTLYGYWAGDSSSNCSQAIVQTSTPALGRTDTVNQKLHICSWESIDKFHLNSGDIVSIRLAGEGRGKLIADAFRLRRVDLSVVSDYTVPNAAQ